MKLRAAEGQNRIALTWRIDLPWRAIDTPALSQWCTFWQLAGSPRVENRIVGCWVKDWGQIVCSLRSHQWRFDRRKSCPCSRIAVCKGPTWRSSATLTWSPSIAQRLPEISFCCRKISSVWTLKGHPAFKCTAWKWAEECCSLSWMETPWYQRQID